jgi:hypothetical protein
VFSAFFHPGNHPCLERVSFLDQFVNTFRIGAFDV